MKGYLQAKFINLIIKHLFKGVLVEDILTFKDTPSGKKVYYKGEELPREKVDRLRNDAEIFARSDIWYLMKRNIRFASEQKVIENPVTSKYDVIFAKAMIYNLEVLENIITKLK